MRSQLAFSGSLLLQFVLYSPRIKHSSNYIAANEIDEIPGLNWAPGLYGCVLVIKACLYAASYKMPFLMKAAIYLESLQLILESMIPNKINTVSDITLTLAQILLNFAFYAFDWKSGSLCSLLPFISLIAKRCVFYNEVET